MTTRTHAPGGTINRQSTSDAEGSTVMVREPDEFGIAVGDRVRGRDVTGGHEVVGRVVEIVPPLRYSGQFGNRYRVEVEGETRFAYVEAVTRIADQAPAAPTPAQARLIEMFRRIVDGESTTLDPYRTQVLRAALHNGWLVGIDDWPYYAPSTAGRRAISRE